MVRNYQGDGVVVRKLGSITYSVDIGKGRIVKPHVDQLREKVVPTSSAQSQVVDDYYFPVEPDNPAPPHELDVPEFPRQEETAHRCPQRQHRPPDRYIHEY